MKKIIFLSSNLDIGGIERATLNYVNEIDKSKYKVYLMLDKKEGMYLDSINSDVKIINFNRSEHKNLVLRKIINFSKLLYFSIKYYHKFDFSACFATTIKSSFVLAKRMSKNNALWIHGNYWNDSKDGENFLEYVHAKKYKKIVVVSNTLKKKYLNLYPNTKQEIYVINNPINYVEMIDKSNEKINLEKRGITFLNVGRHEEKDKNIKMMIQSFAMLVNDGYDIYLWLVGDGPDKSEYVSLVDKLNINNRVTFYGKQSNVFVYYKKCDCVLLSSHREGNPVVFLETKVMNRPIISTDVSDAKEEINGYGIVVDNDIQSYYLAMKEYLDKGFKIKNVFDSKKYNNEIMKKIDELMR